MPPSPLRPSKVGITIMWSQDQKLPIMHKELSMALYLICWLHAVSTPSALSTVLDGRIHAVSQHQTPYMCRSLRTGWLKINQSHCPLMQIQVNQSTNDAKEKTQQHIQSYCFSCAELHLWVASAKVNKLVGSPSWCHWPNLKRNIFG